MRSYGTEARTKKLKIVLIATLTVFLGVANAQIYDFGVMNTEDEFTGARTCFQRVDNSLYDDTGITLSFSTDSELGVMVWIVRYWGSDRDTWMFSSASNTPRANDLVYVRFPDGEVITRTPDFISVDTDVDTETVAWTNAGDFARRLANTTGDLRVRFSGTHGSKDFTINAGVLTALRSKFFNQCVR